MALDRYLLSALGVYSLFPGTNELVVGSPLFSKVQMDLESGATLTIKVSPPVPAFVSHILTWHSLTGSQELPYMCSCQQRDVERGSNQGRLSNVRGRSSKSTSPLARI